MVKRKITNKPCDALFNNNPLVSVVVLCYKNRHLLNGMLNSIIYQTYSNIQLIISDDGSEDFNVEEVKEYVNSLKKDNIKDLIVRRNYQNIGTVRHISEALLLATGEYIIFTAADDRFQNNNVFAKYVDEFKANREKIWLVASCNILTPDYKRSIYITPTNADRLYFESNESQKLFSRWSRRGMAVPCSMAFRKKAFEVVGGIDLDYHYLEDWPLVLKLLRAGYSPIFMKEVTAVHSAGGVTNSNQRYGIEVRKRFFDDKELVYQKEVKPYIDLLSKEDLECLKVYRKEINKRNYFLQINWKAASFAKKIIYLFNPQNLLWLMEVAFDRYERHLRKPFMLIVSQACLLSSVLFFMENGTHNIINMIYKVFGYVNFGVGFLMLLSVLFLIPFSRYVYKKRSLRKMLVN